MKIVKFVSYLDGLGVKLKADGDQLRCRAPKGVLTDALWQQIAERKGEILTFLRRQSTIEAPIQPSPRNTDLPLSFSQQRLWFLNQLERGSATYNEHYAMRLIGPLQIGPLTESINALVRRHEILRTSFPMRDGEPFQKIEGACLPIERAGMPSSPSLIMPLSVVSLQGLPESEQEAEIKRLSASETEQPFNLEDGPLWRMKLLQLFDTEHVLLLTMHHIISDAWSVGVIMRDLSTFYEAFCHGHAYERAAFRLPELTIQYADFAIWQRKRAQDWERQLSYWREQLAGAPPLFALPTDHARPAIQSFRGSSQTFSLPQELVAQLQQVSAKSGATLFMTWLAVFKVLLYRYSGSSDLFVGTPMTNRVRSEIEPLIGFFANTVVLRTELSGNASFLEVLASVRQVALDAYKNQEVPFEKVVEALQPERSLSYSPLFNVMFVLQNAPRQSRETTPPRRPQSPLTMTLLEREHLTARFDLTLSIEATQDEAGLIGRWEYNTDLFEHETITRMSGHFQTLLSGIITNPDLPIAHLPLLTESEKDQLLVEWNDTQADYPSDKCIHQFFEEQVERTPQAVAVVFEDQAITYRELNAKANQLAHYLMAQGVGPDVLVGICLERSVEMVVGLLGILKAGGAYVPLDPTYPPDRLAFMLEDAKVPVLLTQERFVATLPQVNKLCLDQAWLYENQPDSNPIATTKYNHLEYCIYTSGSTGRPKGAMNEHQGIFNRLLWMQEAYELTSTDRVLQKTPFTFDVSVWEFFWPLMFGARLVVARPEGHKDPQYLVEVIKQQQITTLHFVPSMLQIFLDAEQLEGISSLKRVICSGEALPVSLMQRFFERVKAPLHNLYGPTEAAIDVTYWECDPSSPIVPIGRPVANTQLYILDSHLQPVPIGVPGGLHLGGVQVARGYLNRPQLTKEKFIPNPFGEGTLYKTGDLCRYLPDGNVEFLGRADYQVKIRGFRIELGEIETQLRKHELVREVVVVVRSEPHKRLVAYFVAKESISSSSLRAYLGQKLPDYMVPSAFVQLEAMPLTPNGKINRRALPAPEYRADSAQLLLPRTPTEEILAAIWQEVLAIKQIGIHDNFFEIGGHSLLATQVVSRIRQSLQVELPLRRLFVAPTIAELAKQLTSAESTRPPIQPVTRTDHLPLSFAQQRLWFLAQLEVTSDVYNIPFALRLSGPLDVAAFGASWQDICERHEVLRTHFPMVDGQARQQISAKSEKLEFIDLSDLPLDEQEAKVVRLSIDSAQGPFNLINGPLLRITLLRLSENSHVLLLTIHHIISDGWSMGILVRELSTLYAQKKTTKVITTRHHLPKLPIQYADFAVWQREWLQGEVLEQQLQYWKKQLANAPALLTLPTDYPRPAVQSNRGDHLSFTLPKALTNKLGHLSRENHTTLFMTLQAAFAVLLSRYSGQEDILIGTPIANRQAVEIENLIGFFVNTLVLRNDLSGNPTFRDFLSRVRQVALDGYQHQALPFELLVERLQPERSLSHSPLFQVMFTLENKRQEALSFSDITVSPIEIEYPVAKFDLTLAMQERQEGLIASWEYNTDLFERATIERMATHFQTLLEGIVANPNQSLPELPLLTEAEKLKLLVEWNDTQADYPADKCIHQLFEQQAERTPEAMAVVFGNQQLTYRELNACANQLAHYLIKLGVGPDVLVAICLPRSVEMVVGLLGILKAGGAYVPLDPSYPKQRLEFMLEDAKVPLLLTHEPLVATLPRVAPLLNLDQEWPLISKESALNPVTLVSSDDLAYCIYTSGSTGRPKGTLIVHKGLTNYLSWSIKSYPVANGSGSPVNSSIGFDATITSIFTPLLVGKKVILLPEEEEIEALGQVLASGEQLSLVKITPAHLEILNQLWPTNNQQAIQCQAFIVGGEALLKNHVAFLQTHQPEILLVNEYGPTETVVGCCVYEVPPNDPLPDAIPIGRPIANTQLYILDRHLQPVPIGVPGELHIGGAGVARGYLNRPELTSKKFIPNPFSPKVGGGRLYKTGDLCCYLPDGNIEYLGRTDYQVKIRGFRIELGEIEAQLSQHESVREVVVVVRSEPHKRLVAYFVPKEPIDSSALRAYLGQKLPDHMIPSAFVSLEAMPLTPNGKIDRRALPAPTWQSQMTYLAPRNEIERQIAAIWQEVLQIEKVGVHDNFFELGGHSLLIVQLHSRLQEMYDQKLAITDFFRYPTVSALAAYLSQSVGTRISNQPDSTREQDRAEFRRVRRANRRQQRELRQNSRR